MKKKVFRGEAVRRWRRHVAESAQSTFTLKFPLDAPADGWDFRAAQNLHNIVSGVGYGSLIGYLCAVHLSGFRLYPSTREVGKVLQDIPSEIIKKFLDSFEARYGCRPEKSLLENTVDWFGKTMKKRKNEKERVFETKYLAGRLQSVLGDSQDKLLEKARKHFAGIIADAMYKKFSDKKDGFAAMKNDINGAMQAAHAALKKERIEFPQESNLQSEGAILFCPEREINGEIDDSIALYQVVALVACEIRQAGSKTGVDVKNIQKQISGGDNHNGLSWLFGVGWRRFVESNAAELAIQLPRKSEGEAFNKCIKRIQQYAKAIDRDNGALPFFRGEKHYAKFRTQVGGGLDSWIGNYWKRLGDLREASSDEPSVDFLPRELLSNEHAEEIFGILGTTADNVGRSVEQAADSFRKIAKLIEKFMGYRDSLPTAQDKDDFDAHAATIEAVFGELMQIQKMADDRCKRVIGELGNDEMESPKRKTRGREKGGGVDSEKVEVWKELSGMTIPDWLKKPRKLNKYTGGAHPADVQKHVADKAEEFSRLFGEWREYGKRLTGECGRIAIPAETDGWKNMKAHAKQAWQKETRESTGIWLLTQTNWHDLSEDADAKDRASLESARETVRFLNKLGRLAQRMDGDNKREIAKLLSPCFADYKNGKSVKCNAFLYNNRGALWKGKYGVRYPPLLLGEAAYSFDWEVKLDEVAKTWLKDMDGDKCRDKLRDWLELQRLLFVHRMKEMKAEVPTNKARPNLPADKMRAHWRRALAVDAVPANICRQMFNLYYSELRGMLFSLLRESFILRAAFRPILENHSFVQTPKADREWKVPRHLDNSTKPIQKALSALKDRGLYAGQTIKNPVDAHSWMCSDTKLPKEAKRAYFSQAPHDWHLILPWFGKENFSPVNGLKISKTGELKGKSDVAAVRMRGPTAYKNRIVQVLGGKWKAGEHTLIIEQEYEIAELRWRNNILTAKVEEYRPPSGFGAVPFDFPEVGGAKHDKDDSPKAKPGGQGYIWDRIVAIDLGERGIGYAVFDIPNFLERWGDNPPGNEISADEFAKVLRGVQPIENPKDKNGKPCADENGRPLKGKGAVSIPSVRELIRAAGQHRKIAQPRQRMQQNYSSALAERRASVIGDVCHAIEALCRAHRGFPVLERQVSGFESGARQLQSVYKSVSVRYVWQNDNDASKSARAHHWFRKSSKTGKLCAHPYLMENTVNFDSGAEKESPGRRVKNTKIKTGEMKMHPGKTVNAAGTSQTCALCGRNPFNHFHAGKSSGDFSGGVAIDWHGGAIRLYEKSDDKDDGRQRKHNQRKLRLPWWKRPLVGRKSDKETRARLKFNMRRPPRSSRSKDTSQSRYFCVFTDCENHWPRGKMPKDHAERRDTRRHQEEWEKFLRFDDNEASQREWGVHADENAAVNIGRRFLTGEAGRTPRLNIRESWKKCKKRTNPSNL